MSKKLGYFAFSLLFAWLPLSSLIAQNRYNLIEGEERRVVEEVQPRKTHRTCNAIVIFFSHAGDNYEVGQVEEGNTKVMADYISDYTGAKQWEIVAHQYDGLTYKKLVKVAQRETEKNELPPYEGKVPRLARYDTIFIGGPVWWGTYPRVMFTFFNDIDLSGKVIIPFTTHEGSGLGRCVSDLQSAFPKAKVAEGFSLAGHEVRQSRVAVEQWLVSIGY